MEMKWFAIMFVGIFFAFAAAIWADNWKAVELAKIEASQESQ